MSLKIGAVQLQDIQGDIHAALSVIKKTMNEADKQDLSVLCFPECFLQGYTLNKDQTKARAINLYSKQFQEILSILSGYTVTAIIGIIEEDEGTYFNTAVVIKKGELLGKYRKVHLFEENFQPGEEYAVFSIEELVFGVNICYDARFSEGAAELVRQGARVIFYPLNNKLPTEKAVKYRDKHIPNLINRAQESGCWVVSSDVVAHEDSHISFGCTAIVSPEGKAIAQVKELETSMITATVELRGFDNVHRGVLES